MNSFETYLLNDKNKLSSMNNLLRNYQFSEEFLIETRPYYDSWKCLRTQQNLSIQFCFKYLYDSEYDSADDWTDYSQIEKYFIKRRVTREEIEDIFNKISSNFV